MNRDKEKAELVEKLKGIAARSTFHAIPNIVQTDRTSIKIIWAIALVAAAGYCARVLITNTIEFFKYDVETVIKLDREPDPFFPAVTICYPQICTSDGMQRYELNKDIETFQRLNPELNDTRTIFERMRTHFTSRTYFNASLVRILEQYRNKSIEDYLLSCYYGGEACYDHDFAYFQLGDYQRCFKFNTGQFKNGSRQEIKRTKRYGVKYGLELELVVGSQDDCNLPLSNTYGLVLYVHNNTYAISEETNGIQLSPGFETDIAISRTYVSKKSEPYSDCIDNSDEPPSSYPTEFVERTFKYTSAYTQQTCSQLCYQNFLITTYGCYDSSLPVLDAERKAYKPCPKLLDVLKNPATAKIDNAKFYEGADKVCLDECPTECSYITYEATISSAQYPTATYNQMLNSDNSSAAFKNLAKLPESDAKNSILGINVYFHNDIYRSIMEKPSIESEVFLTNIGGAMGLFLGSSVLSIVEILEVFIELGFFYYRRKSRVSNQGQMNVKPITN